MRSRTSRRLPFKNIRRTVLQHLQERWSLPLRSWRKQGMTPCPFTQEPKLSPRSTPEVAKEFPLILTTGARLPMFIHSRTFRLDWTRSLRPDPMVDINPQDAQDRGIAQEDWVSLSTPRNSIKVKANLTEMVPPGVVNMYHDYPEASVNLLRRARLPGPHLRVSGLQIAFVRSEKNYGGTVMSTTQLGFSFDVSRCSGCMACMAACFDQNDYARQRLHLQTCEQNRNRDLS